MSNQNYEPDGDVLISEEMQQRWERNQNFYFVEKKKSRYRFLSYLAVASLLCFLGWLLWRASPLAAIFAAIFVVALCVGAFLASVFAPWNRAR